MCDRARSRRRDQPFDARQGVRQRHQALDPLECGQRLDHPAFVAEQMPVGQARQNLDGPRSAWRIKAVMAETTIDLRGLKCPLPALRARKALAKLPAGDVLVVECTDPLAELDIPNLVRETGDALEGRSRDGEVLVFRIRKS
jgi:tRNA 2-thiouridine synthesizing protein A